METVTNVIFLGFKTTANSDCSHEIKRCLFFGRKAITNIDNVLKSRDITLPRKVRLVKAMVFNMLSRFVIAFLQRNKHLLISWLQSPSTVILGPKKIKSATVSTVSPSVFHEVMRLDAMILVF